MKKGDVFFSFQKYLNEEKKLWNGAYEYVTRVISGGVDDF
jgi:hypothetical protein